MINHWIKKVGTVRLTNGHLGHLSFDLPKTFIIKSIDKNVIRCLKFEGLDGEFLNWIDQDYVLFKGKKHKLLHEPAFSMVLYDYVFTLEI